MSYDVTIVKQGPEPEIYEDVSGDKVKKLLNRLGERFVNHISVSLHQEG